MRLHLLRHATPVPRDEASVSDPERELTQEGRVQAREVGHGIESLRVRLDAIATSPYTRARETTELAAEVMGFRGTMRVMHELTPDSDPSRTRRALAKLQPAEDVLVVGHKPHFPKLAAALLTGDLKGLDLQLGKASLCTIDIPLGTPEALGELERLMQAHELRALAHV